jgi:Cupin-like domain
VCALLVNSPSAHNTWLSFSSDLHYIADVHDVRRWRARRATDAAACGSDDDALETQLAAALAGDGGGAEDSSMLGCSDDYVDSDAASSGSGGGGVVAAAAPAAAVSSTPHPTAVAATRSSGCKATMVPTPSPPPLPPSFSQIDLSLPPSELRACFPEFPGLSAASEVVLSAGQMLYLPAGWFHEV